MSRVGEKVKKIRINLGMSQKELAKKLGIAESFVNDVELGRKVLNESLMERFSKVLGQDINDLTLKIDEEEFEEEREAKRPVRAPKPENGRKPEAIADVWSDALGSVLRTVPVYGYDLNKAITTRQLPVLSNKVEGHAPDKVLFLQIQDDDMVGFRMVKGDIAFGHITHEIENNAVCLIEYNQERVIRQIKKLDQNKVLLLSNKGSLRTETVNTKEINVLVRLDKVEIKL